MSQQRALVAELIGTFALIFIGAGAGAQNVGLLGVAFAHGFVVLGFIYAYGHISGTHINPAVTLSLLAARKISGVTAATHIAAQLAGGIAGAFALRYVLGGAESGLGVTVLAAGVTPVQGLVIEVTLTFFLVNSVLNTAVSGKGGDLAGIAIAATLIACILIGAPLTGASLNPARTLGPALATGTFADLWLYFVGPILGGLLAALLYNGFLKEE